MAKGGHLKPFFNDFVTLNTAADDVLKRCGCIYAGFSGHAGIIA
jgi:hypothetical protein